MKKSIFGFISILLFSAIQAQVVINSSNMPVPDDIIEMRTATSVNGANYTNTGSNYTWDFTALSGITQAIDTFVSVSSTPAFYNVAFNLPIDPVHQATVAQKQSIPAIPMITITDGYSFQKNSGSQYSEVGVGLTISGATLPLKFDNPDVRYKFPIAYGTSDSTDSKYSTIVPGLGYYGEKRHRVNVVDGWGVLYLPNDTFNVIRVKSTVKNIDTIYVTALSIGMNIPRNVTEYKWLAPGHHEPVLEIDQTITGVTVKYYSHISISSISENLFAADKIKIFPNPATDKLTITLADNAKGNEISILDIAGKLVYNEYFNHSSEIDIPVSNLAKGLYFIRIANDQQSYCRKFIKE